MSTRIGLHRSTQWLGLGCVTIVIFFAGLLSLLASFLEARGHLGVFLLASLLAILEPLLYGWLFLAIDSREPEPLPLILATFFWGATVAVLIALVLNTTWFLILRAIFGSSSPLPLLGGYSAAGPVEETAKGLALLLVYLTGNIDGPLDGLVYAGMVALGFAAAEDISYFARAYLSGGFGELAITFFLRALLTGLAHPVFTSFIGLGLGFARQSSSRVRKLALPVLGWVVAAAGHSAWDVLLGLVDLLGKAGVVLGLIQNFLIYPALCLLVIGVEVALVLRFAGRKEAAVVREQLGAEVSAGIATAEDVAVLSSGLGRRKRELQALLRGGLRRWLLQRQLDEYLLDLAFVKWHRAQGDRLPRWLRGSSEEECRAKILALRQELGQ
ncbi:MAG: PrsW family intramembrane metalloprotease [Thermorudis peleae]|nr:PrsW family intramembrane metalloprotease [Thermorudis peleae]